MFIGFYAITGESSLKRRTPVATERVITIVANTVIFCPPFMLIFNVFRFVYHGFIISRKFLRKKQVNL